MLTRSISPNFSDGLRRVSTVIGLIGLGYLPISFHHKNRTLYQHQVQSDDGRDLCSAVKIHRLSSFLKNQNSSDFNVNARHPFGWTALHLAATKREYLDSAKILLEHGADPNAEEFAPKHGSSDINQWHTWALGRKREFSSDVIEPTAYTAGFTPLHYAVLTGNVSLIKLLFEYGADPFVKSSSGFMPKDLYDPLKQSPDVGSELEAGMTKFKELKEKRARELRRKFPLEQKFREKIVGQDGPINSVASAVRRKENGWHDDDRPLVFMFLGSSGIGKTALAKQLATFLHNDDSEGLIRIDMSEFQSKHEVSKFLGSPPGYIGHEEGGQLTEKLKKKPNAVVLLDEVEKAHIDVLTVMLQVFDEGRLTDGKGNTVDCRDAIFIMTSNLAQQEIAEFSTELRQDADGTSLSINSDPKKNVSDVLEESSTKKFLDHVIYPILRNHFHRDEFLGRINETLLFLPFSDKELDQIVEMELDHWKKRAEKKHDIDLTWSPEVVEYLRKGYNIHYGARSIKHEIDKKVVNLIAKAYENEQVMKGGAIRLFMNDGTLGLKVEKRSFEDKKSTLSEILGFSKN